jgi:cytochrome c biogenesis protein CcmG/thiol:disulfide interchange protein DsbE
MRKFLPLIGFFILSFVFFSLLEASNRQPVSGTNHHLVGKNISELGGLGIVRPQGKYMINFFASWCPNCQIEHPHLMQISKQTTIIGIAWRDKKEKTNQLLLQNGNPYRQVIQDPKGILGAKFGVSGVPQTFFVDENGVIVNVVVGPVMSVN